MISSQYALFSYWLPFKHIVPLAFTIFFSPAPVIITLYNHVNNKIQIIERDELTQKKYLTFECKFTNLTVEYAHFLFCEIYSLKKKE